MHSPIFLKGNIMIVINAEIHTMDNESRIIENGYIIISNGKISDLGKMDDLHDRDDIIFDAEGKAVYPGFIDAHTHLGMFEDSLTFEGDDGNEDTEPVTPQLRAIDGSNPMDGYFPQALEAGITTVLISPGSTNPVAGQIAAIKTKGKSIDKMIIREPAGIKCALGENPKSVYNDKEQTPVTRMAVASLIRETLHKAEKYYNDKIKWKSDPDNYDEPDYDIRYEAFIPVFKKEIPLHFHTHRADDIFTAGRICREFGISYIIVHGTDAHLICDELDDLCLGVLSGPFLTDRSKPELKNLTPASPGIISKSLPVAIITDHPEIPIQYLTMCAAIAVREGMNREDALRAITIEPARICGIADRVGSVEKGKDADMAIFDGDPLDIMCKPSAVIINGDLIRS